MTASPYSQILLQAGSRHTPTLGQLSPFFLEKVKEMGPATTPALTYMSPNHYENDHPLDSTG